LEIYNEEIRDLLGKDRKNLELKERPDLGIYVKDKKEFAVNSSEHMERIMSEGIILKNGELHRKNTVYTLHRTYFHIKNYYF
jgi:hypothetical protein